MLGFDEGMAYVKVYDLEVKQEHRCEAGIILFLSAFSREGVCLLNVF
jgi:hypothetical protein